MARRTNYGFNKRQKEKQKQEKAERKREKRLEKTAAEEAAAEGGVEGETPEPTIVDDPSIVAIDPADLGLND